MELTNGTIQNKKEIIIVKCCICQKILSGDKWVEKNFSIFNLFSFLGINDKPSWSHGYCPSCTQIELNKINQTEPVKLVTEINYEQHGTFRSSQRRFSSKI